MQSVVTGIVKTNIPVKKNSYKIGNKRLYKPKEITEFEDEFGCALMEQGLSYKNQIKGPFKISATFYVKNMAKDMDGMLTSVLDCLELYEIIENDKYMHFIEDMGKAPALDAENEKVIFTISPLR